MSDEKVRVGRVLRECVDIEEQLAFDKNKDRWKGWVVRSSLGV
jgi:hypothetical protein